MTSITGVLSIIRWNIASDNFKLEEILEALIHRNCPVAIFHRCNDYTDVLGRDRTPLCGSCTLNGKDCPNKEKAKLFRVLNAILDSQDIEILERVLVFLKVNVSELTLRETRIYNKALWDFM